MATEARNLSVQEPLISPDHEVAEPDFFPAPYKSRIAFLRPTELESDAFPLTHAVSDAVALVLAWLTTVQFQWWAPQSIRASLGASAIYQLAPRLDFLILLWIIATLWRQVYRRRDHYAVAPTLLRVAESDIVICTLAIVVTFFSGSQHADLSRAFILTFAPTCFLYLSVSLYASLLIARKLQNLRPKRLAVVGDGQPARDVIKRMQQARSPAVRLTGLILPEHPGDTLGGAMMPILGTTGQLAELINKERLDGIIVAGSSLTETELEHCRVVTKRMGVAVSRLVQPAPSDSVVKFHSRYGLHYLETQPIPFTRVQEFAKRVVDVIVCGIVFLILSPLLLVLVVLVRLTSPGPVFYRSARVGKGGRHFTFWKFRSMYVDRQARTAVRKENEKGGHIFKIRQDPRVTPLGRWMRRFSMDELPQLYNVLIGDMSLVGPRPLPAEDLDPDGMSREFTVWAEHRARVRPGITGFWQIRGRSDLNFEQMMQYDLDYIQNWSLLLDLRIVLETPLVVLSGRGAY